MEKDLKWIKKHYGEKMMHLCRENFYKILEQEGLLPKLLQDHFFQQRDLADDIIEQNKIDAFKDYIFSFVNVEGSKPKEIIKKSAVQLMDEAGYILYPECKTENDIQSFRKYWANNEELCTFRGGRLNSCRVWFAVKKDCENIKRKNFFNPRRQDKYGTSVISIQFAKNNSQTLSIKNRYNHTVNNPDNTFNSNLDNIIPGLTDAFYQDYGVKDRIVKYREFELIDYVFARGMYFKYNYEIDNIYYCPNNVLIKDFTPMRLSQHNILLDYFAFNIKNKTVSSIYKSDSFLDGFSDIESMEVKNNTLTIKMKDKKDAIITFDNRRRITGYCNENLTECGDNFLYYNKVLTDLTLPNLTRCGWGFLYYNKVLTDLTLPNLTESGGSFLCYNKALTNLILPNLTRCQYMFLYNNEALKNLALPNLTVCGWDILYSNKVLTNLSLPKLTRCGDSFLYSNEELKNLSLPNLTECGDGFLRCNKVLTDLTLPNLTKCGWGFLGYNEALTNLILPNLTESGGSFLCFNKALTNLNLPKLTRCQYMFLYNNEALKNLSLPNLTVCGWDFLYSNKDLTNLSLPKLTSCGDNFLYSNEELKNLSLPNLTEYGDNFLYNNKTLKKKFLSKVKFKSLKAKLLTKLFKKEKKLEEKVK